MSETLAGGGGQLAGWYEGWDLSDDERARFRRISQDSRAAKLAAMDGCGPAAIHEINTPRLNPSDLMPQLQSNGLRTLSLFSGGGGLDLGFERAGFDHEASVEILSAAGDTLRANRPNWKVLSGADEGDVRQIDWHTWRDKIDVIHGGPPCQPFSSAGRQRGADDVRDMLPEFARAVQEIQPRAWVAENVRALVSPKFIPHLDRVLIEPLSHRYAITHFLLDAQWFGVPQIRRRVFIVGVERKRGVMPAPSVTHVLAGPEGRLEFDEPQLSATMGVREALGLSDIGFDAPAPTLRSTLTGPRHTTSILSSASAQNRWRKLEVWPNGVAPDRESAQRFVAQNGHFRLAVPDCSVLQGFPADWKFTGAVYMALGQLGNSVAPPVAYAVANALASHILD